MDIWTAIDLDAGPLQALVLAMAGRANVSDELSGDGLAQLRTKIGAV
jgi:hypothetical protein